MRRVAYEEKEGIKRAVESILSVIQLGGTILPDSWGRLNSLGTVASSLT